MATRPALLVLGLLLAATAWAAPQSHFVDWSGDAIDAAEEEAAQEGAVDVSAALATLAGAPLLIKSGAAAQVNSLLKKGGAFFARPAAVLLVILVGGAGSAFKQQTPEGVVLRTVPAAGAGPAAHAAVASSFRGRHVDLDSSAACGDDCAEEALAGLVGTVPGALYLPGEAPLQGTLELPSAAGGSVTLSLQDLPMRLWAAELATLYAAAVEGAQAGPATTVTTMYTGSLVGLQAVGAAMGEGSPLHVAAKELTAAALADVQRQLAQRHANSLVAHVALTDPAPVHGSLAGLLRWKAQQSGLAEWRALLSDGEPSSELTPLDSAIRASAWVLGVGLLLVLGGSIYCLCFMSFAKDSLLFATTKMRMD